MLVLVFPMTNNEQFRHAFYAGILCSYYNEFWPLRQRLSLINDAFAAYLESSSVALFGYRCCKVSAFCDNQQTFVCKIR